MPHCLLYNWDVCTHGLEAVMMIVGGVKQHFANQIKNTCHCNTAQISIHNRHLQVYYRIDIFGYAGWYCIIYTWDFFNYCHMLDDCTI